MDEIEPNVSEVTEATSPETPVAETPAESTAGAQTEGEAAPAADAWTPNYKVKAYDNEFEIPEMFRGIMNKENEKEVRKYFEKAFAVDVMQPKHQKLKEEYEGLNQKYSSVEKETTTLKKNIDRLGKLIEIGDFGTFFDQINIPREAIQKWMYNELQANSLPPDQRALYDSQKALRERAYHAELEKDRIQEAHSQDQAQLTQYQVEKRQQELGLVLSRPDVSTVKERFDAVHGEGQFLKEVIERATYVFEKQGKDLSAEEAVMAVVKLVGVGQQTQTPASGTGAQASSSKPPVIPHVEGKSTSPAKKMVTNISDIKRLRTEMFGDDKNY